MTSSDACLLMLNKQQDFRAIEIMKSGTAKDQASAFLMEKELRANIEAAMIPSFESPQATLAATPPVAS